MITNILPMRKLIEKEENYQRINIAAQLCCQIIHMSPPFKRRVQVHPQKFYRTNRVQSLGNVCQTEHEHLYIFFVKVETLAPIQSKAMHCTPRDKQSNACRSDESIAIVVSSTKMVVSVSDTHSGKSLRNITNKDRPRLDP